MPLSGNFNLCHPIHGNLLIDVGGSRLPAGSYKNIKSKEEVQDFVDKQEEPKAEGKCRIVDLRFGDFKVNAQSLKRTYQEKPSIFLSSV